MISNLHSTSFTYNSIPQQGLPVNETKTEATVRHILELLSVFVLHAYKGAERHSERSEESRRALQNEMLRRIFTSFRASAQHDMQRPRRISTDFDTEPGSEAT